MRRAVLTAVRFSGHSRRLYCTESLASQIPTGSVEQPGSQAGATIIAEAISPDLSAARNVKHIGSSPLPDSSHSADDLNTTFPCSVSFAGSASDASVDSSHATPMTDMANDSEEKSVSPRVFNDSELNASIRSSVNEDNDGAIDESRAGEAGAALSGPSPMSVEDRGWDTSVVERLGFLVKKGRARQAAGVFRRVLEETPEIVDKDVVWLVMPSLARVGWGDVIVQALTHAREANLDLSLAVYNCGLNGVVRSGRAKDCSEIIEYMWTLPIHSQPDAATYNHLIGTHFYDGDVDAAYAVLKEMKNRMIYPTWSTYHTLIAGCIRRDNPRRAYETLLAVEQQRFEMSALIIGQVLVACAEVDDVAALAQLIPRFDEALPRYAVEMERLAERRSSYKLETTGEPLSPQQRAAARGDPVLELAAIKSIMHAAYRNSRPEIAEHALRWHNEWYPETVLVANNWYCLIGSYAAAGNFSAAFDAISRMRTAGIEAELKDLNEALVKPLSTDLSILDEQYYRLVDFIRPEEAKARADSSSDASTAESKDLDGHVTAGTSEGKGDGPDGETGSLTSDSSNEVQSSPTSLSDVVLLRNAAGEPLGAASGLLSDDERTVGAAEFNSLIAACSMAGDLDRAFHTYDEAVRLGIDRNADTFNALILGCIGEGHFTGGFRVADEMKKSGIEFNSDTVTLLVRLAVRCGKFDEALKTIETSVDGGVEVSSGAFQTLARKLMGIGNLEHLRKLIAVGESHGVSSVAILSRIEGQHLDDISKLESGEMFIERHHKHAPQRNTTSKLGHDHASESLGAADNNS